MSSLHLIMIAVQNIGGFMFRGRVIIPPLKLADCQILMESFLRLNWLTKLASSRLPSDFLISASLSWSSLPVKFSLGPPDGLSLLGIRRLKLPPHRIEFWAGLYSTRFKVLFRGLSSNEALTEWALVKCTVMLFLALLDSLYRMAALKSVDFCLILWRKSKDSLEDVLGERSPSSVSIL